MVRGVLIEPSLYLGFDDFKDAEHAAGQHICLCRNEDILFPDKTVIDIPETDFDTAEDIFNGFELIFEKNEKSFLVGYNRFDQNRPMYGWLKIVGSPVRHIC
jgi:hypothetical protein